MAQLEAFTNHISDIPGYITQLPSHMTRLYGRLSQGNQDDIKSFVIISAGIGILAITVLAYVERDAIKVYVLANKVKVFVVAAFTVIGTVVACVFVGKEVVLLTYAGVIGLPAALVGGLILYLLAATGALS